MIECRAVRPEELDSMLSLMCDAFGLPFGPARDLFYKDPYFEAEKKRVLVADGQIVSCLTIVEAPLWIGRAVVRVAGIAGVATAPAHRRQGYAHRLLADTLPAVRTMGFPFAALFPFSYDYYRKLGWERVSTQYSIRIPRIDLPAFAEARHVRAAHAADHREVARIYDAWSLHKSGHWVRDSRRWSYLFEHAKRCVVYQRDSIQGYALYDITETAGAGRTARILEMVAQSEEACRGITGYFAGLKDIRFVTHVGSMRDLEEFGFPRYVERGDVKPDISIEPGVMFRVVDLPAAVRALSPNLEGFCGEATLTIDDPTVPRDWPRGAAITGNEEGVKVEPLSPGDPRLKSNSRLEGDVRAWSQTLTGCHGLADAVSLNKIRIRTSHTSGALDSSLSDLFPQREIYVPPADHF